MEYRLGVDVGGTFTDLLLIEEKSGKTYRSKVPSTPSDPSQAVLSGTHAAHIFLRSSGNFFEHFEK